MFARVAFEDGASTVFAKSCPRAIVLAEPVDQLAHLIWRVRHGIVAPRITQVVRVWPVQRNQSRSTGQRLENPDGRRTGQQLDVLAPRYM